MPNHQDGLVQRFGLDLAEDLPDLVFDGVRPGRALLEAVEVGKERLVDEVAEVIAR